MSTIIPGTKRADAGRKPPTVDRDRYCAMGGCSTRLSSYNTGDLCHAHSPRKYPRVRGRTKG